MREEKAILTLPSPAFREEIPPEFQNGADVLGTLAAACLVKHGAVGKGVTSSQSVCGSGETEAQHANAMHLGLLSLCPRPAGLPAGQGLAIGQQNPQHHPCASPEE